MFSSRPFLADKLWSDVSAIPGKIERAGGGCRSPAQERCCNPLHQNMGVPVDWVNFLKAAISSLVIGPGLPVPTFLPSTIVTGAMVALCLAVAAICYANSLRVPFQFDDFPVIAENPTLRSWPAFLAGAPGNRWVPQLTFAVQARLHALDPAWLHVGNVEVWNSTGDVLTLKDRRHVMLDKVRTDISAPLSMVPWMLHRPGETPHPEPTLPQ